MKKKTTTPSLADAALVDVSGPVEEHTAPSQSAVEGKQSGLRCHHMLNQSERHPQSRRPDIHPCWADFRKKNMSRQMVLNGLNKHFGY